MPMFFNRRKMRGRFGASTFVRTSGGTARRRDLILTHIVTSFVGARKKALCVKIGSGKCLAKLSRRLEFTRGSDSICLHSIGRGIVELLNGGRSQSHCRTCVHYHLCRCRSKHLILTFQMTPVGRIMRIGNRMCAHSTDSGLVGPINGITSFIGLHRQRGLSSIPGVPRFPTCFDTRQGRCVFSGHSMIPRVATIRRIRTITPILSMGRRGIRRGTLHVGGTGARVGLKVQASTLHYGPLRGGRSLKCAPGRIFISLFGGNGVTCSMDPGVKG